MIPIFERSMVTKTAPMFLERFDANHCHAVYGDHVEELAMVARMMKIDVETLRA